MSVKISLLLNMGAGVWRKGSLVLFRFIQVPLLLTFLGVDDYGRWLVLSSLPSWLTLANMGFGSVASNEMSMAVSAGNLAKARSLYATTYFLIFGIGVVGVAITALLAPYIPWENLLGVTAARHQELTNAVIWLVISVFVSFLGELFNGRFKAAKKAHLAMLVSSFMPWISLLSMVIVLNYSKRFDHLALASLCSVLLYLLSFQWLSWRAFPQLHLSIPEIKIEQFRTLFRKGIAFQAFPLGNAFLFQGSLLVIQTMLGPAAVTLFGTVRTLVRSLNQAMELINQSIWPELSHLFGSGDKVKAARLHQIGVGLAVVVACTGVIGLAFLGPTLYNYWVGKAIELPQHLLLLFLLPIPFNALWFTSSVVHAACNQHEGLAWRYVFASLLSIAFCVLLCYFYGIEGAALSTLVADIVMIPYVLHRSLQLTDDNWKGFSRGILLNAHYLLGFVRKGGAYVSFKMKN
ncbi:O-antigen transporter [Flammeovirgaceae bacterium 311]|nr:O-antigen transporter [Flammeovirgaceae bacterium 311]